MRVIQQSVRATLLEGEGQAVLLIGEAAEPLYLRFGLRELEGDGLIFPASLLDDWGREIGSLALFEWIQANGSHFPRAELFGLSAAGASRQRFLRELDLATKPVCYVARQPDTPMPACLPVAAILVSDAALTAPRRAAQPALDGPVSRAAVSWWRVPPGGMVDPSSFIIS
jgi:hypothetical protein